IETRARSIGTAVVVARSRDPNARSRAAQLLRDRIGRLDPRLVSSVAFDRAAERDFAWDHRWLFANLADLEAARDTLRARIDGANPVFVPRDDDTPPASDHALRDALDQAEARHAAPVELVAAHGQLQILLVRTAFNAGDVERNRAVRSELAAIARGVQADV